MTQAQVYSIGVPGKAWGADERASWLAHQQIKRQYQDDVLAQLEPLKSHFNIEQYGALPCDPDRYPLIGVRTRQWDSAKPTALITGGVHGYETSGVHGALRFLETQAQRYANRFNVVVAPCVSPWAYETINRWNPAAVDPNRSFVADSPAPEAASLMRYVATLQVDIAVHIDLHETTDTDNSEFRPALAARDNVEDEYSEIPDGFYLVGDELNPAAEFQTHIIEAVSKVTHIAPPDERGKIIGVPIAQHGVINYRTGELGLCSAFSHSNYATTTEVYPDSPLVDAENCINAQVTAVVAGLDYVIKTMAL
tara:strand:- start:22115 stop:23041 length:927 start_codon:yes stop_codon:yes gene_type:complete